MGKIRERIIRALTSAPEKTEVALKLLAPYKASITFPVYYDTEKTSVYRTEAPTKSANLRELLQSRRFVRGSSRRATHRAFTRA